MKVSENKKCDGCPFQKLFPNNKFVAPRLPGANKDLFRILVGEAPGAEEELAGEPFIGGSGRVLKRLLTSVGIDWEGLTICNTLQCRPPSNIYPTDAAARKYISKEDGRKTVRHCIHVHVLPLLKSKAWQRVDMIGEKALRFIGLKDGIKRWRGTSIEINTDAIEKD